MTIRGSDEAKWNSTKVTIKKRLSGQRLFPKQTCIVEMAAETFGTDTRDSIIKLRFLYEYLRNGW